MRKLLVFSVVLLFISCKKQDTEIIYGYQYFPNDSGRYVVYDVVDILHDDIAGVHDTDTYQIKEVVGEEDIDGEGEAFNKFYRYFRDNDSSEWQLKDTWVLKKTGKSVELVEENDRVIKMAFSISYDQYWDCNALNNNGSEQCYYADIYMAKTIGALSYDSTVVVERNDFSSYIDLERSFEVYAANIGKVSSYFKDLEISNGDTLDVLKGNELYYTATDFGK